MNFSPMTIPKPKTPLDYRVNEWLVFNRDKDVNGQCRFPDRKLGAKEITPGKWGRK